ncbi:hypothetical protein WJX77_009521 [Trebouxia sp. C0004]
MFRLVYSGEGATEHLVDDSSLTQDQKWQLLFDRNWRNLARSSQTKWLVYLRKWKKWIDDQVEQPEGYLVFPNSKVTAKQQAADAATPLEDAAIDIASLAQGGIRSDADVARMRQLLQETAFINHGMRSERDGHGFYFGGLACGLVTGRLHIFQPQ